MDREDDKVMYRKILNKHSIWTQAQSGQAIVLLALALVALLGVTGLAVDGGGLFFLQRDAQNATDAAIVASTYAICATWPDIDQQKVIGAGMAAANANGFYDGVDGRTVTIEYPPTSGEKVGDYHYVNVTISATKPAYFIQVVYKGPLQVTVPAVGYCEPAFDPHTLKGMVGLSETCNNNVQTSFSDSNISGGMFSNNIVQMTGSNVVVSGGVEAHTSIDTSSSNHYTVNSQTTGVDVLEDPLAAVPYYQVEAYAPTGIIGQDFLADTTITSNHLYNYYTPGGSNASDSNRYNNGVWKPNTNAAHPLAGLYYVDGDVYLGNHIYFDQTLGVSIVATGQITNHLNGSGNPNYDLTATVHYFTDPRAHGILFFSNYETPNCGSGGGNSAIDIRTGNFAYWEGLLYAPLGMIKVSGANNGSDDLTITGMIIGQGIQLSGSTLVYTANPDVLTGYPPMVSIAS